MTCLLSSLTKCPRWLCHSIAPDFGEGFPGLPVVESDEQEAGEGADERHQQRHHGHAAGRAQVGDAAGTNQSIIHYDLLLVSLLEKLHEYILTVINCSERCELMGAVGQFVLHLREIFYLRKCGPRSNEKRLIGRTLLPTHVLLM